MATEAERDQFWHSPPMPDMSGYPFDVPSIMRLIHENGLEVVTARTLEAIERELADMTERCRTAEYRVRTSISTARDK